MDLADRLITLKKKVMARVVEAAGNHDTRLVAAYSALATRIEDDERAFSEIEDRIAVYEKELSDPVGAAHLRETLDAVRSLGARTGSGREEGAAARRTFVEAGSTRGYRLTARGKTAFETARGRRVAIPFANEQRPDRWFLGISDEKYDVVVLLCQDSDGKLYDFVLPWGVLEKLWSRFSRSGGQVKFNVSRSGGGWYLLVPGHDNQSLNKSLGAYASLRE